MQRTDTIPSSIAAALAALAIAVLGAASSAHAQRPLQQVLDLNRQGMEAYMNLEVEQAREHVERALQVAQQGNVTGSALSRTYLNLGVIAIGGFGDNGRGLNYFVQAIQADASVELDPLTSSPEIQTVFALAQSRAGASGGGSQGGGSQGGGSQGGGSQGGGSQGGGSQGGGSAVSGNLPHQPVPEQLAQTAVPVYIEVADAANVYLFYKAVGMREFRRVEMQSVGRGYGFEIPCSDVYQGSLEYYIVAFGSDGTPMGFAGSQQDPVTVPIVGSRTQPAPALPGRAPPEPCGETECPPGMEGCASGGGGMGSTCMSDSDCGSGLTCEDDLCVTDNSGGGGGGGGGADANPHFFVRAGLGVALGLVNAGMQADTCPPDVLPEERDPNSPSYNPDTAAACGELATLPTMPAAWENGNDPNLPCGLGDGLYCVRVAQGGLVPNLQIRLAVGYYFLDWLGAAAFVRFAPFSGHGDLAFVLFGARLQIRPLGEEQANQEGFVVSPAFWVGFSGGQVQHQPPGNGEGAPWIISGLQGVPIGGTVTFRFNRYVGVYLEAEFMFQFPTFMFNMDYSAGLQVSY